MQVSLKKAARANAGEHTARRRVQAAAVPLQQAPATLSQPQQQQQPRRSAEQHAVSDDTRTYKSQAQHAQRAHQSQDCSSSNYLEGDRNAVAPTKLGTDCSPGSGDGVARVLGSDAPPVSVNHQAST